MSNETRYYEYKTATHIPGKRLDGSYAPLFEAWLNEFGAQGWLLSTMTVSATNAMSTARFCVFARRIEIESARP